MPIQKGAEMNFSDESNSGIPSCLLNAVISFNMLCVCVSFEVFFDI